MKPNIHYWAAQWAFTIGDLAYLSCDLEPPRREAYIGFIYNSYDTMPDTVREAFMSIAKAFSSYDWNRFITYSDDEKRIAMIVVSLMQITFGASFGFTG